MSKVGKWSLMLILLLFVCSVWVSRSFSLVLSFLICKMGQFIIHPSVCSVLPSFLPPSLPPSFPSMHSASQPASRYLLDVSSVLGAVCSTKVTQQ